MIKKKCEECGKALNLGKRFCSYFCSNKGKNNKNWKGGDIKITCVICKKDFYVNKSRGWRITCSRKCRGKWQSENLLKEKGYGWKGGRKYHEGYVLIFKPEHPFAEEAGYISEHRLVMEAYLGRYLNKNERVHHINGIRDDNRIENLMLCKNESEHQKIHNPKGIQIGSKKKIENIN